MENVVESLGMCSDVPGTTRTKRFEGWSFLGERRKNERGGRCSARVWSSGGEGERRCSIKISAGRAHTCRPEPDGPPREGWTIHREETGANRAENFSL